MSKRGPYPFQYGLDQPQQDEATPRQWRSLEEYANAKEFKEALAREFPEGASELEGSSRREFIQLMGASVALAGLAGCRRPEDKVLPYTRRGDTLVEGRPLWFASVVPFYDTAIGVTVESHEGRPTKIEGNEKHPDSRGATTAFVQAQVLDLYDPDRSRAPREKERVATWEEAVDALRKLGAALKDKKGKGFAVLTEAHRSPTTQAQLEELKKQLPEAKVVRYSPFSRWASREGAKLAFGQALDAVVHVDKAKVLVALDSDFLHNESSPVKNARAFADGRRLGEGAKTIQNRLYAVEAAFTVTGAAADHRLRVPARDVGQIAAAILAELSGGGAPAARLDAKQQRFVKALANDLASAKGESLVVCGDNQPPAVHAIVHAINHALGNVGKSVEYVKPFSTDPEGPAAIVELAKAMSSGEIDTLLILGGNPVFDAPADADFAAALGKVKTTIHLSHYVDETSKACGWHLNRAHWLEQWSDARTDDGTAAIGQPLIAPLYGGKTDAEVLDRLLGGQRTAYQLVQATWQGQTALNFAKVWRKALHDGVIEGTAAPRVTPPAPGGLPALPARFDGMEVVFLPDAHAYDGRLANNSWMQEMPDQMTKLTWDNAALMSPATFRKLALKQDGSWVEITVGGKKVKLPALRTPGVAEDTIVVTVGQGRTAELKVGKGKGFDTYPLRASTGFGFAAATAAKASGAPYDLAQTQEHHVMEGRPLVREASLAKYRANPKFAKEPDAHNPELLSLWKEHEYNGHKWSMVVDLQSCIGCNACMVACQAENNIPVVGKEGVIRGREMHWMRIDRYYTGDDMEDPQAVMQPLMCQHCENAPCEQVCPVGATTHSPEGLNDIAYNRCIGTRYCANNCPYKVRRFNFFNYNKDMNELRTMQYNPEVTVRTRGVIEKCSYCVQRIQRAKIDAHRAGQTKIADGSFQVACQQACPTRAIAFGDLNDKESVVAKAAALPQQYQLLAELNIKPRTNYLARVRNPNPELG
jgi:molybdopterin-containing oxidoreductase family iron-sulfur binding subunit